MKRKWYPILAVAFTYAAMLMGGGFSTGREIIQFHARFGAGGVFSLIIAAITLSYVGVVSLALAVEWKSYDYKSFVMNLYHLFLPKSLAPKAFLVYDVLKVVLSPIGGAVMIAAFAAMLVNETGMAYGLATAIGALIILVLVMFGGKVVRAFGFWGSIGIVIGIAVALAYIFEPSKSFSTIASAGFPLGGGWLLSGILYMAYNAGCIIAAVSIAEVLPDRFSAITAGWMGGITAVLCYTFVYLALMMYYPQILDQPLPLWFTFNAAGMPALRFVYDIILSLAVLTTGVGSVLVLVKRFMPVLTPKFGGREFLARFTLSALVILGGLGLSFFGIIQLIAVGYTIAAWLGILFFVVPVIVFGSRQCWRKGQGA